MLRRTALVLTLLLPAPLAAQSKEEACALQNDVVGAIQRARLDRVRKAQVVPTLMEANPDWPAALESAMPPLVDWVYGIARRDLRDVSLGEVAQQQCLDNWEALQSMTQSASN